MVKFNAEMKSEFQKLKTIYLATASKAGVPNVVPIGALFLIDDETLWVIDNFMKKTMNNVKENPIATFDIWNPDGTMSYQVKCDVKYENSGADYEKAKDMMHQKRADLPAKGLLKLTFKEIYQVKPGPGAGDLILG